MNKVLWNRVFFWTKEKDWIQSLKQNLTTFTWNKLFYFLRSNKSKIWDCFRSKAWIIFARFVFVDFVSSFFSSCRSTDLNLRCFSSFSQRIINHLLTRSFTLFFITSVVFFFLLYMFFCVSKYFNCFFIISRAFFFWFLISDCLFWDLRPLHVHFFQVSLKVLQEVAHFQRALNPLGQYLDLSCLFFICTVRIVKWSLRLNAVTCKFFTVVQVIGYILPYDSPPPLLLLLLLDLLSPIVSS